MKIAILGAGRIGSNYGRLWAQAGHTIVYGVRDPQDARAQQALEQTPKATLSSVSDAVQEAEVVLLALPGSVVAETLASLELDGVVIIDATNGSAPGESPKHVQQLKPQARVVRAFNYYGFDLVGHASFDGVQADAFLCGNDAEARATVARLATDAGFAPLDLGDLSNAAPQDALLGLWFALSKRLGTRTLGFKALY